MADRSRVSAFLGGAVRSKFTQGVLKEISSAARSRGVRIIDERVDAVMGVKHAEAVMFGGSVHPCDGVVIVPRRSSSIPAMECARGDHGGAVVDESMRTSSRGVYAAGDCAGIKLGSGALPSRLHSSSLAMGNVSGVNAAGGSARASISRCISLKLFGVEMCSTGVDADAARKAGLDAVEFASEKSEDGFSTSLVYDRATHQVYGAHVSGRGALMLSDYVSLVVSSRASLDDLAFQESPYIPWLRRGLCPISLTAGRAIAQLGA